MNVIDMMNVLDTSQNKRIKEKRKKEHKKRKEREKMKTKWTKQKAEEYIKRCKEKGLKYWSARDYLKNHKTMHSII
jgi:predicted peroxiredoxin